MKITKMFTGRTMRVAALAMCTLTVAVPVVSATAAMAQPGGRMSPEERNKMMMDRMKDLNLTDDQKSKITAIWADRDKQNAALREDTTTSMEDKRPKMMAIQKDASDKVRGVLTDDQKPKYDEIMASMPRGGGRGGNGGGAPQL